MSNDERLKALAEVCSGRAKDDAGLLAEHNYIGRVPCRACGGKSLCDLPAPAFLCPDCLRLIASTLLAASDAEKTAERIAAKLFCGGGQDDGILAFYDNHGCQLGSWYFDMLKAAILAALTSHAKGDGG